MRIHSRWNRLGLSQRNGQNAKSSLLAGKNDERIRADLVLNIGAKKKKTRKIAIKPFGVGLSQRAKRKKSILAEKIDTDKSVNWVGPLLCDIDVSLFSDSVSLLSLKLCYKIHV